VIAFSYSLSRSRGTELIDAQRLALVMAAAQQNDNGR